MLGMGPPETTVQHTPSAFIWALTFAAGISGLLFGYDTGAISSTLVSIGGDLGHPLTNLDEKSYHLLHESERSYCQPSRRAFVITSVSGMVVGRSIVGFAVARWWSKPRGPAVHLRALACGFPGETGHFEHIIHRYGPGCCLRYRVRSVYAEGWLGVDGGLRGCAGGVTAYIDARVAGESKVVCEGRQVTTSSRHSSESLRRWERRHCGGGTACHQDRDCGGRSHK